MGLIYSLLLRSLWALLARLPLAYLGFSVLRGALTSRYLYPFCGQQRLGVATVLGNAALLLGLFLVLGLIFTAIDRTAGRSSRRV